MKVATAIPLNGLDAASWNRMLKGDLEIILETLNHPLALARAIARARIGERLPGEGMLVRSLLASLQEGF